MNATHRLSERPALLPSPTILVVEDEVLIRMTVSDYLRASGFHVIEAESADEAVKVLRTDTEIDVVFSDINMPGDLDGFGLAKWIRQERPGLKIILTSGVAHTTKAANDLCEDGPFLAKPYVHGDLVRHIHRLLGRQISI